MNSSPVSDDYWLRRFAHGEREAFSQLYRRHSERVFAYLLSLTKRRDVAEELLQAVFVRALRSAEAMRGMDDILPYLLRIARNLAFDSNRAAQRDHGVDDEETQRVWLSPQPGPAEAVVDVERCRRLQDALAALPAELREVVALRIYDGLSFKQIAQLLNQNLGTVFYRYQSALRAMKEALND